MAIRGRRICKASVFLDELRAAWTPANRSGRRWLRRRRFKGGVQFGPAIRYPDARLTPARAEAITVPILSFGLMNYFPWRTVMWLPGMVCALWSNGKRNHAHPTAAADTENPKEQSF